MPNMRSMGDVDASLTSTQSGASGRRNLMVPGKPRKNIFESLYSDKYVPMRGKVAEFLGGKPDNPAHGLHEYYMETAADEMTPFLGEPVTKGILDVVGHLNEIPSYWAQKLSGNEAFNTTQGYDFGDIQANNEGMERAFKKHRKQPMMRSMGSLL